MKSRVWLLNIEQMHPSGMHTNLQPELLGTLAPYEVGRFLVKTPAELFAIELEPHRTPSDIRQEIAGVFKDIGKVATLAQHKTKLDGIDVVIFYNPDARRARS